MQYKIQANERLTKVKEKSSTIKFDVFVRSFILLCSNVPENKCHKHKWHLLFFTRIKLVARVLVCAGAITRIKWRRMHRDVGKLYIPRNKGGRRMISVEDSVKTELQNLQKYVRM